ncbi:hypothetical protein PoB_000197100 [Plakobranchus ocellatus]|uniref:Uncharacterized protein n=1 Tax=Plakobranchus ocellatus TaxID=259542 RepID=A0AAV3XXC2_9GAST|nr:hypothetical protein PoB_000197100 [Plakobranchus ocellatus]
MGRSALQPSHLSVRTAEPPPTTDFRESGAALRFHRSTSRALRLPRPYRASAGLPGGRDVDKTRGAMLAGIAQKCPVHVRDTTSARAT